MKFLIPLSVLLLVSIVNARSTRNIGTRNIGVTEVGTEVTKIDDKDVLAEEEEVLDLGLIDETLTQLQNTKQNCRKKQQTILNDPILVIGERVAYLIEELGAVSKEIAKPQTTDEEKKRLIERQDIISNELDKYGESNIDKIVEDVEGKEDYFITKLETVRQDIEHLQRKHRDIEFDLELAKDITKEQGEEYEEIEEQLRLLDIPEIDMKELKYLEEENVLHQKELKSLLRSVESVSTESELDDIRLKPRIKSFDPTLQLDNMNMDTNDVGIMDMDKNRRQEEIERHLGLTDETRRLQITTQHCREKQHTILNKLNQGDPILVKGARVADLIEDLEAVSQEIDQSETMRNKLESLSNELDKYGESNIDEIMDKFEGRVADLIEELEAVRQEIEQSQRMHEDIKLNVKGILAKDIFTKEQGPEYEQIKEQLRLWKIKNLI
jgi:hypothetical protein